MVNYIRVLILSCFFLGCQFTVDEDVRIDKLSGTEQQLVGKWRYQNIEVNRYSFIYADRVNEPTVVRQQSNFLSRRFVRYSSDRTYEILWENRYGEYQLGGDFTDNWQPNFGVWSANEELVIHNEASEYEHVYVSTIDGNKMTRVSDRVMESTVADFYVDEVFFRGWRKGDTVRITENFIKVE